MNPDRTSTGVLLRVVMDNLEVPAENALKDFQQLRSSKQGGKGFRDARLCSA